MTICHNFLTWRHCLIFFDFVLFLLSILVTGPVTVSCQYHHWFWSSYDNFLLWPEIWKLELPSSGFCWRLGQVKDTNYCTNVNYGTIMPPPPRLDPNIAIFRGCTIFFRTTELQHKLLISVEFPIFNWKSAKKKKKWMWFCIVCSLQMQFCLWCVSIRDCSWNSLEQINSSQNHRVFWWFKVK